MPNNLLFNNIDSKLEDNIHSEGKEEAEVSSDDAKYDGQRKSKENPTRSELMEFLYKDSPLVSIFVLAYNKLEYTKLCIENIYKYTKDIDYEMVLVNNASTDDTRRYFESLPDFPKKRIINIHVNNPNYAGNAGIKASKGKYIAFVSNDVVVTKNWLNNLLLCIQSDDNIGYVVPCTNYASNMQTIAAQYNNIEEMQRFAEKYNVSDPRKWEERIRIIPYLTVYRKDMFEVIGYGDYLFHTCEFSDDDLSFRARRSGYKLILCCDTFVHHFGSVTTKQAQNNNSLKVGRDIFARKYKGLDVWRDALYDLNLISLFETEEKYCFDSPAILGIDPRCGGTILQMKNKFRNEGIPDSLLYAYSQNPMYYTDLISICEEVKVGEAGDLIKNYFGFAFDYILLCEPLTSFQNPYELLSQMLALLKSKGHIFLSITNLFSVIYDTDAEKADGITYIDIDKFAGKLKKLGFHINKYFCEQIKFDEESKRNLGSLASTLSEESLKKVEDKLITTKYYFDINILQ